ncbi:MAG: hypothetical protein O3B01_26210 [Planctomycetota bacterium]|nr:hypothetical protein [Planctomycetota bacterium]MDA1142070.1 hypothetical protein [Planctomycetota bacterium]
MFFPGEANPQSILAPNADSAYTRSLHLKGEFKPIAAFRSRAAELGGKVFLPAFAALVVFSLSFSNSARAEDPPALNLTFTAPAGNFYSGTEDNVRSTTFSVKLTGLDTFKYYECVWDFVRGTGNWSVTDTSSITTGEALGTDDSFDWLHGTDSDTAEEQPEPLGWPFFLTGNDHDVKATVTEYEDAPADPDSPDLHGPATGRASNTPVKKVYVSACSSEFVGSGRPR